MILTCPNCGTQYVVKDGAIPPEGRQVRCAACKHSWHQDPDQNAAADGPPSEVAGGEPAPGQEVQGEPLVEPGESEAVETADFQGEGGDDESLTEASLIEPRSGPEAEQRAYQESVIESGASEYSEAPSGLDESETTPPADEAPSAADWNERPVAESASDDFSPFVPGDFVDERQRSPFITIMIVVLVILAAAAAFWFLAPANIKAKLGIVAAGSSPLQVSNPPHIERVQLASGNELLTVSGRVINPSAKEQQVPPLEAKLTNKSGKLVYRWVIPPPAHALAAGTSAAFNSAEVNVPPGGEYITITVGQPNA